MGLYLIVLFATLETGGRLWLVHLGRIGIMILMFGVVFGW